jgi:hypothetical protein
MSMRRMEILKIKNCYGKNKIEMLRDYYKGILSTGSLPTALRTGLPIKALLRCSAMPISSTTEGFTGKTQSFDF